jgi:hypothetical protein
MSTQDMFSIVAILYCVTNLGSMGLELNLQETIKSLRSPLALGICSRNGGAMFVAFAAFPVQDPNVLVMILLAVPVPLAVWLILARYFASRTDKALVKS